MQEKLELPVIAKVLNQPATIKVADKLLSLGGTINTITPQQFKEQFNCEYVESIISLDSELAVETLTLPENDTAQMYPPCSYQGNEWTFSCWDKFVICNTHSEVGYVLCTTEEIAAGTPLMLYAGNLHFNRQEFNDPIYNFGLGTCSISARNYGGLARFLPHLPYGNEFAHKEDEIQIQYANVQPLLTNNAIVIYATTLIKKDGIIGFHYGPQYWADRLPQLLTFNGLVVPNELYRWDVVTIKINPREGEYLTIRRQAVEWICDPEKRIYPKISSYRHREKFIHLNFLPLNYGRQQQYDKELNQIQQKWQSSGGLDNFFKLAAYYVKPLQSQQISIVCSLKKSKIRENKTQYNHLLNFFKPLAFKEYTKVNEIHLLEINDPSSKEKKLSPSFQTWLTASEN